MFLLALMRSVTTKSKKMRKYLNFIVLFVCLFFQACSEEPIMPNISVADGTIDYFSESMSFPSSGGTKILNFTSNINWTLTVSSQSNANWCTVSHSSGSAGTYNVIVTVAENASSDERNTTLVFTAGNITKRVFVVQKQRNALTLTTDRFEVDPQGGQIDVEVKSNIGYEVQIPEEYKSWISLSPKTRALSAKTITFDIAESKEYDKREGRIIISSGDLSETVKVYQAGSAILVLSQNEYTLGSEGGTVSIDISSNFEYEVDMPKVDWIKPSQTRAVSSHTLTYEVSPNASYEDREAVIAFKDAKTNKKESVTFRQRQKDAILLSNKKIEISQDGGTFFVDVNSNVEYSIVIPSSCSNWISRSDTSSKITSRSIVKTAPSFRVEKSEQYEKREGEIYFKYKDVADTLKVYQSGGAILVLSQSDYYLEGVETTISVVLKSNIDYNISTSADWITEISTRAVSSSTKKFNVALNKTGKSRMGKIMFNTVDGKKTATINITQASIVEAKALQINFFNTSGTIGGYLYIGSNYNFSVSSTPSNASTDYVWKVENADIGSVSWSESNATLYTKNFGKSKLIVTDKNSGISASYDFGTAITNFSFTENTGETGYGYPMITMVVGEKHKLKYSCNPSYATNVFSDLRAFNFKEVMPSINTFVIVDKSSVVDIDAEGVMTALKVGTTIINANNGYGIAKNGSNDGIYVKVISEYTENEYNDDFQYANTIKEGQKMKFRISSPNDVDVFKFTNPDPYGGKCSLKITYEGDLGTSTGVNKHLSFDSYNSQYSHFNGMNEMSFKPEGETFTYNAWVNTSYGYLRFYIRDYWKIYQQGVPTGYFTIEIVNEY